jgi:hypothetical protein
MPFVISTTKHYLLLLADQGLVTIGIYRKRRAQKKGRDIKRPTGTTIKITDKGLCFDLSLICTKRIWCRGSVGIPNTKLVLTNAGSS